MTDRDENPTTAAGPDEPLTDGRLRKGRRRRELLLEATMQLIEQGGVGAVTQRAVAKQAGLPPSAVFYYFPRVDALLLASLARCNDEYVRAIDELSEIGGLGGLRGLAALVCDTKHRGRLLAEYELVLLASRRPEMRKELERWSRAVHRFVSRYVDGPAGAGVVAAIDGLFLGSLWSDGGTEPDEVLATLIALVGGEPEADPPPVDGAGTRHSTGDHAPDG